MQSRIKLVLLTASVVGLPLALAQTLSTPTLTPPSVAIGVRTPSMPAPVHFRGARLSPSMPGVRMQVNVNTATLPQLKRLGLSAKVAQLVIRNRPYRNQADLLVKVPEVNITRLGRMRSVLMY